jgi:uncharacterized protein YjdB
MRKNLLSILVLLMTAVTGAWAETIDLSTLTADYTAQDGATLTGKVPKNVKISIADGATVTLDGVDISGQEVSIYWGIPGIDCLGDATIILKGENTVSAGRYWEADEFYEDELYWYDAAYSGIYVHAGKTLTIKGNGKLTAKGGDGPGIGGAYRKNGGNIEIQGGTIIATGGYRAAGIGGGDNASCGYITITTGVTSVTATKTDQYAPYSIGAGYQGSCGTVTIGGTVTGSISTNPYTYEGNPTVNVTSLTLSQTEAALTVGQTLTLTPTVLPDDASNKTVAWTTSNASVATVSNSGVVTAVGGGTCTITATATNGTDDTSDDYTATCAVSVHAHSFTYQASGATITASCSAAGCNITSGLTLTISAPTNLTFDYEPKEATLNNDYNTTVFPGTYAIEYYQGTTKLGGAPVNAGSYKAQVTVGDQTASVDFTISGQEPVSYTTKTKEGNSWVFQSRTTTEYLLVQSKSDDYYLMQDGRTYVVKGNQTLGMGLVYEGTVNLILCANSSLTIYGGIWHIGSELNIYAEEGAEQTATISVAGTATQPALSGGTIVMNSGNLSATAADGGQLVGDGLVLLLNYGVSDINLSGGEEQENGLVKYTATQVNALSSLNLTSTPAPATPKAIALVPGVWAADNATFAVYAWNDKGNAWFPFVQAGDSYVTEVPDNYTQIILARMNPEGTDENPWNNVWNQTDDIDFTAIAAQTVFTITGWGDSKSPYTAATPLDMAKAALQAAIDKVKAFNLDGLATVVADAEAALASDEATIESLQAAAADLEAGVKAYVKGILETAIPMMESLNIDALADAITAAKAAVANEEATVEEMAGAMFGLLNTARPYIVEILAQTVEVSKLLGIDTSAAETLLAQGEEASVTDLASTLLALSTTAVPAVKEVMNTLKAYMTAFDSEAVEALGDDFAKLETDVNNGNIAAVKTDIVSLMEKSKPYLQASIAKLEGHAQVIGNETVIADVAAMKEAVENGGFAGLLAAVKKFEADFLEIAPAFVSQLKNDASVYENAGKTNGIEDFKAAINDAEQALAAEDKTIVTVGLAVRNLILAYGAYMEANNTFTIAGTKDLTGTEEDWQIVEANNMAKNDETGLYMWTAENVVVSAASMPQFKVVVTALDGQQAWIPASEEGNDHNWIITPDVVGGEGVYTITITFNVETQEIAVTGIINEIATGITAVAPVKPATVVFNLSGQRVTNAQKGLYIVNGKKVVVK